SSQVNHEPRGCPSTWEEDILLRRKRCWNSLPQAECEGKCSDDATSPLLTSELNTSAGTSVKVMRILLVNKHESAPCGNFPLFNRNELFRHREESHRDVTLRCMGTFRASNRSFLTVSSFAAKFFRTAHASGRLFAQRCFFLPSS